MASLLLLLTVTFFLGSVVLLDLSVISYKKYKEAKHLEQQFPNENHEKEIKYFERMANIYMCLTLLTSFVGTICFKLLFDIKIGG